MAGALIALAVLGLALPARAQDPPETADPGSVLVVNVSGLIDPVLANFIVASVDQAERDGVVALVLQLNSSGSVISDEELAVVGRAMVNASVPVDVWVGPSGATAEGAAAELVGIADVSAMAPGTRMGRIGEQRLPLDEFGPVFGDQTPLLLEDSVGADEALDLGLVTDFGPIVIPGEGDEEIVIRGAPTVGDFVVNLDGFVTREITQGDQVRREPVTVVLFSRLSILDQMGHTIASPAVAYLLFTIGLALLVFELFTAGVGVAGVVGAGCLVGGSYGLTVLPTRPWAVGLALLAFFAFAVDVQTGVPRLWTALGMVAFVIGSFALYDGVSLSWITLGAAIIGMLLTFYAGMPSMVRARFSTPTIGRDWMVGEMGEAVVDVDPTGVVRIREALWRAETNRATPVASGERVRVVAIEGLLIEVEPEEGGARDYRERGKSGDDME